MFKKIIIGILTMTIISTAVAAVAYNLGKQESAPVVAADTYIAQEIPVSNPESSNVPHDASPQAAAAGMTGEPFTALAQIRGFDDTGMDVVFENGDTAYIELGPEEYWRSQDVELRETDIITIEGNVMEDMYHATKVITSDGSELVLRTENGQPMWSGSTSSEQGQQSGEHTSEFAVSPEEWVTYTGILTALSNGNMTIQLEDGITLSFKTGQPRFFQSQGVEFSIGDEVKVNGFYNGETFSAGDVTQLSTGIMVLMLDTNGRPLWAGPGNGNGNSGGGSSHNPTDTPSN